MRDLLNLPERSIIQGASEGSINSNIKLLLEFILCVRCFVSISIFVHLDLFPIQLLHQDSLIHCGIQDANQKARKLMLKLISTDTMPKSLFITDVETEFEPIAVGGFGRVFRGEYKGQKVALKMLDKFHRRKVSSLSLLSSRSTSNLFGQGSLTQDFCREALAWRSLSHRFVLPLVGIFKNKWQLYLVSPFMTNGTLSDWRKKETRTVSELHRMVRLQWL